MYVRREKVAKQVISAQDWTFIIMYTHSGKFVTIAGKQKFGFHNFN